MRVIILSDCHGSPHLIQNVLDHSEYEKTKDKLIFAGDLVDINYQPVECLDLLLDNNALLLWGNHDVAYILNKSIWPQNQFNYDFCDKLHEIKNQIKVAIHCKKILITHAGLSESFYKNLDRSEDIIEQINSIPLEKLWNDNSPLWYRPVKDNPPEKSLNQVVGHTPPGWLSQTGLQLDNYISVDPYSTIGFDKTRYRYAIIEENGSIRLMDSNNK